MTEVLQDFTIYQGDNKQVTFEVVDENGDPLDLTGYSAVWVMYNQKNKEVILTKTSDDDLLIGGGTIQLNLSGDATLTVNPAKYQHELEITDPVGTVSTVTTGVMTVFYSRA
jgi:hypothetical protein